MKKEMLYLYHKERKVKTLGPGDRYAIWTQGCPHNCRGCIAPESHPIDSGGTWVSIATILDEIDQNKELRGITVSGGEPFLQAEKLIKLFKEVKKRKLDIICYTGYNYEDLLNNKVEGGKQLLEYIDILIDGKYIEELNNENYLRGSDNQRIIHLTNAYKAHEEVMNNLKNRNVEFRLVDMNTIFIVGIPSKERKKDLEKIRKKIYEKES